MGHWFDLEPTGTKIPMRLTLSGAIRTAAVLSMIAAIVVMALVGRSYRRDRRSWQDIYTRSVKERDIFDDARKALSAVQDAEVQVQDYALTGETTYSEAYAADIRQWQDEFGTLEVEAQHDRAVPMVQDLSKAATRVLDEMNAVMTLADQGKRDAALDRIRKGSEVVYLEQARDKVAEMERFEGLDADEGNQQLIRWVLKSQKEVAGAALLLFCLAFAGPVLLFIEFRRQRGPSDQVRSGEASYLSASK